MSTLANCSGRLDHVVGIEPEGVLARGLLQRGVAGRGEVIDPGEFADLRPERLGDAPGAVGRPGVHDDDLIEDPPHRLEAMRQVLLLRGMSAVL